MRLLRLSYNFNVSNSNFLLHFFDFVAPHRDCKRHPLELESLDFLVAANAKMTTV